MGNDCLVSVDCADFRAPAPSGLTFAQLKAWFSYKYRAAGIRYEIALCILTSDIVWIHGGFPAGDWNDLEIFRHALIHELDPNERVETDKGYRGVFPATAKVPGLSISTQQQEEMRERVRGRHETINERMKNFKVMGERFRHDIRLHTNCFKAVAVLTQLAMENGDPIFSANYIDPDL